MSDFVHYNAGDTVFVKWSEARHLRGRAGTVVTYDERINRFKVRLHHDGTVVHASYVDLRPTTVLDAFVAEATEDWFVRVE